MYFIEPMRLPIMEGKRNQEKPCIFFINPITEPGVPVSLMKKKKKQLTLRNNAFLQRAMYSNSLT